MAYIPRPADLLDQTRCECNFSRKQQMHQHGRYSALSVGISFGGGQKHPQNLHHEGAAAHVLATLLNHIAFICLALLLSDDSLILNFANSIFCACTFNFGPKTATFEHMDSGNLPFGWCSVTVLGRFNPKQGGHLILWDLKLVIEFPPGSTILFPSAILRHSNTPIGCGETRYSFTQYTSGGLFRWVDQGLQLMMHEHDAALRTHAGRWAMGLGLYASMPILRKGNA
ncbi:uncharacterized protein EV420DRAFT_1620489 [Desarmillaria tabescens]|uniref:Uncharacterized protein n=1 Tax=Armillaria tabescens TaxID=1929756 RepID=A0AA39KCN1_ARMTA|nr:uncharacterized protein EV420DRAFT_1620489 [Desarmillaria tabescens]KAK0458714.1 hypothetical protein EV420DRAFT_1620489 [Desarmillaria tabescens]